ncbi:MAG: hypothetical protein H6625_12285 [Bdellovibrionaceae bacterium]|nr:hypothetical protein [Pseudobdellovibrionaceae bacterium]
MKNLTKVIISTLLILSINKSFADYKNCIYSNQENRVEGFFNYYMVDSQKIAIETKGCDLGPNDNFCTALVTCDGGIKEFVICKAIKNANNNYCPKPIDCINETNKISTIAKVSEKSVESEEPEEEE